MTQAQSYDNRVDPRRAFHSEVLCPVWLGKVHEVVWVSSVMYDGITLHPMSRVEGDTHTLIGNPYTPISSHMVIANRQQ
jgi:hypothetical protein